MKKQLRAYTVVPQELYIERGADRQIRSILAEMGRPGYVLVARQMGKTNLILHARKTCAVAGDIFVYLDVSNEIPEFRMFLRNIVDVTLEQIGASSGEARNTILSRRAQSPISLAHKEHEFELALILSFISGRLVICLDEIDALASSPFSDQLFSFIRSVYFSGRANNESFSRLTYLLSGVAEPSDIIKNKDVSPFNIGEKIYLDDFSFEEYQRFLAAAKLDWPQDVRDGVYSWTNGHPRMTWDVCAALEQLQNEATLITSSVDQVVRKLYFSDVDVPPVDHIKRTVQEHKELRDALMSMHYGRGESISDALRTRLYLAGISKFSASSRALMFKNRILEESLSEDFLQKLSPSSFDAILERAKRSFIKEEYFLSIAELESARDTDLSEEQNSMRVYWQIRANFRLHQYDMIIRTLREMASRKETVERWETFYLAAALMRQNDFGVAVKYLQTLAANPPESGQLEGAFEAKVDFARASFESRTKPLQEVEALCLSLISAQNEVLNSSTLERRPTAIMAAAHITLARVRHAQGRLEAALESLLEAEEFTTGASRFEVHLFQLEYAKNSVAKALAFEKCIHLVNQTTLFSASPAYNDEIIDSDACYRLLYELERRGRTRDVDLIYRHVLTHAKDGPNLNEIVVNLGARAVTSAEKRLAFSLIDGALSMEDVVIPDDTTQYLLGLAVTATTSGASKYADRFLSGIKVDTHNGTQLQDLRGLYEVFKDANIQNNVPVRDRALTLLRSTSATEEDLPLVQRESLRALRSYVAFVALQQAGSEGDIVLSSRRLIAEVTKLRTFELPFFPADFSRVIHKETLTTLKMLGGNSVRRERKKVGRNEIVRVDYKGEIRTGKFKHFMADLRAGDCKLLE